MIPDLTIKIQNLESRFKTLNLNHGLKKKVHILKFFSFTTLRVNPADDKVTMLFLFFPENRI